MLLVQTEQCGALPTTALPGANGEVTSYRKRSAKAFALGAAPSLRSTSSRKGDVIKLIGIGAAGLSPPDPSQSGSFGQLPARSPLGSVLGELHRTALPLSSLMWPISGPG